MKNLEAVKMMTQSGLDSELQNLRALLGDIVAEAQQELKRMDAQGENYVPLGRGSLANHPEYRERAVLIRERIVILKALK